MYVGKSGSSNVPWTHPDNVFNPCGCVQGSESRHPLFPILFRIRKYWCLLSHLTCVSEKISVTRKALANSARCQIAKDAAHS